METYGNDLSADEGEGRLSHDVPPTEETASRAADAIELDEGAGVFPVAESETVVVRSSTEVEHDAQNLKRSKKIDDENAFLAAQKGYK